MSQALETQLLTQIRRKFYLDSVALMRHSRALVQLEGVTEAAMMMGTPANQSIMHNAGLLDNAAINADGGDLLIGIRGADRAAVQAALELANEWLDQPRTEVGAERYRPHSLRGALQLKPDANLALISVAGEFAVSEARKAINQGLHVMIFSDNVPLAAEVEIKQEAKALGRLVMGPDCGTAIVNGVPLAFANQVRRGDIGIVGASGTGIQEVCCLLDQAGKGISHALGSGGRDLQAEVGGITTLMALAALEANEETRHIVLISKPPCVQVAAKVLAAVAASRKSFTLCFLGQHDTAGQIPANARLTTTLKEAAEFAAGCKLPPIEPGPTPLPRLPVGRRRLVGLFTGGTLCAEAQVLLLRKNLAVASNVPIPGVAGLEQADGLHRLIDLGADEYTQGRPHPMIEPSIRDQVLLDALTEPDVALVILDTVLGYGAHPDPAGHLQQLLQQRRSADSPLIVASVTGTEADPQVRSQQISKLKEAGLVVVNANADAVNFATDYLSSMG